MAALPQRSSQLEWAVAGSALEAGASGDLHVVVTTETHTLLCVIDGLGHGPRAQQVAEECASIVRSRAGAPLLDLFRYCHEGLRDTRGVVMTAVLLDRTLDTLEWAGVGNVECIVWRPDASHGKTRASVITRGGVVGYRLPPLRSSQVDVAPGDLIVLVTDGIQTDFAAGIDGFRTPDELARELLRGFAKGSDDALILVARYGDVR